MLATLKSTTMPACPKSPTRTVDLGSLPSSPLSASSLTNSLTIHAQATTLSDTDLTSLSWLQKPGVLTSMCTALTGSPHRVNKSAGVRAVRKPKQSKPTIKQLSTNKEKEADKMVNVILNVRNRRYNENGEEVHKPPLSFACMIFMALESSPTKTLPVKEIYDWIVWKFPFYRTAASGWKNSIRHNLSLNKCFRKVDRYSTRSKSALSKGGFWTVDPDYRRSLLTALERCPYHPYHSYLSPPLSPSSSSSSLESVDPAERDAALTMCMISGGSEGDLSESLATVYHDHSYCKKVVKPPVTVRLPRRRKKILTLDEIAAAAEMILAQEEEVESESCEDCDSVGSEDCDLGDSGYGGGATSPMDTSLSLEEMGADALLCLATSSRSSTPATHSD